MNVVQVAKTETSKWLKLKLRSKAFAWQAGYGSFSVSASLVGNVQRYIENQQQHHKTMGFQDEFRELCRRHGLTVNEEYAWD